MNLMDTTSERKARKVVRHRLTTNFASAWAQLPKLQRQRALSQNCGQIMKKNTTFHLSQLLNNPPNLNFAQHFPFQ